MSEEKATPLSDKMPCTFPFAREIMDLEQRVVIRKGPTTVSVTCKVCGRCYVYRLWAWPYWAAVRRWQSHVETCSGNLKKDENEHVAE